ncbi:hypothetical protein [Ancylobacter mangrovi]|uniref:hypothetical protein n=1 Tax=Ancylobacter mangrovi TaxID=2972472 RepID=UPI0021618830|nr:hypothetical protein [Ancylobacter mangrovi]MCS0501506.1 hypothetical protein [Ancylobacter mangrovi]
MRNGLLVAFASTLFLAACQGGPTGSTRAAVVLPGDWIKARPIQPPQSNVQVGSLYYAREEPTEKLDRPLALEPLCFTDLDLHGIALVDNSNVPSFDVTSAFSGGGHFSGLRTRLLSAGLSGDVTDYYDLKLVNVTKSGITHTDAENLFEALSQRGNCRRWFSNLDKNLKQFAIYQIESVYSGDIALSRKQSQSGQANLSLTLAKLQPQLEAELKRETGDAVTGKTMVFAVVPLVRNPQAR